MYCTVLQNPQLAWLRWKCSTILFFIVTYNFLLRILLGSIVFLKNIILLLGIESEQDAFALVHIVVAHCCHLRERLSWYLWSKECPNSVTTGEWSDNDLDVSLSLGLTDEPGRCATQRFAPDSRACFPRSNSTMCAVVYWEAIFPSPRRYFLRV
jgi:hypothetical protein